MTAPAIAAFDELAPSYDADFTTSKVGSLLREVVWHRLDAVFAPGERILDLGCGTGEDAVYLARRGMQVTALDASAAMVVETRRKGDAADVGEGLKVRLRTIEEWTAEERTPLIDGVLSNFGALNCVADLDAVAAALASALRPGGRAVLVVMGPWVPWEWFWYLVHGAPTKAFRRLQRGGVRWRGLVVRYPSPGTLKKHFEPAFRVRRLTALGLLVPPSYAEGWAGRHPRLVEALARLERRLAGWPPAAWLADHYILELERSQESTG